MGFPSLVTPLPLSSEPLGDCIGVITKRPDSGEPRKWSLRPGVSRFQRQRIAYVIFFGGHLVSGIHE